MMSRVKDITEKLEFNENPKIKIKGEKIEVNADAASVLKLMGCIKDEKNITPNTIFQMFEILFSKKDRKKIDEMNLSFKDLRVLIETATEMVTDSSEEEVGE